MHRTQIYLQDDLYNRLKCRSQARGISISELIRRAVEKDLTSDIASDAQAYFQRLRPLQSFTATEPAEYVRNLRSQSRLLRDDAQDGP